MKEGDGGRRKDGSRLSCSFSLSLASCLRRSRSSRYLLFTSPRRTPAHFNFLKRREKKKKRKKGSIQINREFSEERSGSSQKEREKYVLREMKNQRERNEKAEETRRESTNASAQANKNSPPPSTTAPINPSSPPAPLTPDPIVLSPDEGVFDAEAEA